ncbi:unnamed protein product [Adineta steineri]|uniref:PDZ domain-containing protein n=1 Tax=Adineta steineri TaxID=433720 RepID=A0A818G2Y6_9BILA|nr:unnamed protein product [Adineta steineri]CAF3482888.1 unnamed protein product [Adineta steineri]
MTVLLENRTISMILMVPDVEDLILTSSSSLPNVEKHDRSDIDELSSISNHIETSNIDIPLSMPVYHGSIVRIDQHREDPNTSDLIIRIPNFQHLLLPSIDTDTKQQTPIKRRAPICPLVNTSTDLNSIKKANTQNFHSLNLQQTRIGNTNRLTTGLRSLSRVFTHNCKSKRSTSITNITFPSALPDVEVITQNYKTSKKDTKHNNFISTKPKLTPPKILFIKRKNLTKNRQISSTSSSSSNAIDNKQINLEYKRTDFTSKSTILTTEYTEVDKSHSPELTTSFSNIIQQDDFNQRTDILEDNHDDDNKQQENESIRLTYEVEQHFKAIAQLISDNPLSSLDGDSLSTHRYSTISGIIHENQHSISDNSSPDESSTIIHPISTGISYSFDNKQSSSSSISPKFHVQTSILQPDISVVRMGTNDLMTEINRILPGENLSNEQINSLSNNDTNPIEQDWYNITHSNDKTFAESYEVTYQIDENEQIINIDPSEYKNLVSWLPAIDQNEYEQMEHVKSHSMDDISRTSNDQISTYHLESISDLSSTDVSSRHCTLQRSNSYDGFGVYISTDIETNREHVIEQVENLSPGDQAGLKENDRILCINGTPVIHEDYTVVLQLIKHGLQTDSLDFDVITNDAYEEFKSQINQIYQ